jgi:hypothetical protein
MHSRLELMQVRSIACDPEPDERGNVSVLVMLDKERVTSLPLNSN